MTVLLRASIKIDGLNRTMQLLSFSHELRSEADQLDLVIGADGDSNGCD